MTPRLALTEAALGLVQHAATDVPAMFVRGTPRRGRILTNALGASTDPQVWLRETAILRLMSVIEAYVDSVSMHRMGRLLDSSDSLVAKLLEDFALGSSSTWQGRHDSYERYHGFSLKSRRGWDAIRAGIEVRNCLVHGMGALTAKQLPMSNLAATIQRIDVAVGSNRMHLSGSTVAKLAAGCTEFLRDVDARVDLATP